MLPKNLFLKYAVNPRARNTNFTNACSSWIIAKLSECELCDGSSMLSWLSKKQKKENISVFIFQANSSYIVHNFHVSAVQSKMGQSFICIFLQFSVFFQTRFLELI